MPLQAAGREVHAKQPHARFAQALRHLRGDAGHAVLPVRKAVGQLAGHRHRMPRHVLRLGAQRLQHRVGCRGQAVQPQPQLAGLLHHAADLAAGQPGGLEVGTAHVPADHAAARCIATGGAVVHAASCCAASRRCATLNPSAADRPT
jgi:hypothetical protein